MKNAVIAIAVSLLSLGSMSCSQLLTKTPATQAYDYAANGQAPPAAAAPGAYGYG